MSEKHEELGPSLEEDLDQVGLSHGYEIHLAEIEFRKLDLEGSGLELDGEEEFDRELDKAEKFDRGPIDHIWRELALGKLDERSAAIWAELIAKRVALLVLNDERNDFRSGWFGDDSSLNHAQCKDREDRAILAIGLSGNPNLNYFEERDVKFYLEFNELALEANPPETLVSKILHFMLKRGHYSQLKPKAAENRVRRLVAKIEK